MIILQLLSTLYYYWRKNVHDLLMHITIMQCHSNKTWSIKYNFVQVATFKVWFHTGSVVACSMVAVRQRWWQKSSTQPDRENECSVQHEMLYGAVTTFHTVAKHSSTPAPRIRNQAFPFSTFPIFGITVAASTLLLPPCQHGLMAFLFTFLQL